MNGRSPTRQNDAAAMQEYRNWVVQAEQKSQEAFDKTVLSLSSGALGISFVFLQDVVGTKPIHDPWLIELAWSAWIASTVSMLISFHLSHLSLRYTINQIDAKTIHQQRPGGHFSIWTAILNILGAVLFFCGVVSITVFASLNLTAQGESHGEEAHVSTSTPPTSTTISSSAAAAETSRWGAQPTPNHRGIHSTASAAATASKEEKLNNQDH